MGDRAGSSPVTRIEKAVNLEFARIAAFFVILGTPGRGVPNLRLTATVTATGKNYSFRTFNFTLLATNAPPIMFTNKLRRSAISEIISTGRKNDTRNMRKRVVSTPLKSLTSKIGELKLAVIALMSCFILSASLGS